MGLLDVDLDLLDTVEPERARSAAAASLVDTRALSPGQRDGSEQFGLATVLYVIEGLIESRVAIDGHAAVELLGPGDLFAPAAVAQVGTVPEKLTWRALSESWVALLDWQFWQSMAAYPSVTVALLDRAMQRADSLNTRVAIAGLETLGTSTQESRPTTCRPAPTGPTLAAS